MISTVIPSLGACLSVVLGVAAVSAALVVPVARDIPEARILKTPTESPLQASARPRVPTDSLGRMIVAKNPFMLPGTPPYEPVTEPAAPAAPQPTLRLMGLVVSQDPSALIDGFPGHDGPRVVRLGDEIGSLVIRRIGPIAVEVAGPDTVWVLTVREPWL